MNTEEKAKAYDKALEKAKDFYKGYKQRDNQLYANDLETIFPELCESEDEKIRKEIIKFLELPHRQFVGERCQEEWIAWLEKLGEQKTSVVDFKAKDWYVSKVDGKIHNIYNSVDKIEPKFHEGDIIQFNGFGHNRYTIKNVCDLSHYINTIGEKMDMSYTDANFELIEDSDKIKLCHAWSEEDEDAIGMAIIALEDMYDEDTPNTTYGGYNLPFNKAAERLKSLKDRVQPQPDMVEALRTEYEKGRADTIAEMEKDWSEEDEDTLAAIIAIIRKQYNGTNIEEKKYYNVLINWLKSLKDRYTWKPSDEQIDTLEHFVRSIGESGYASPYDNNTKLLYSLLEQLKKLKA